MPEHTATGRPVSVPNLQNVPVRTEEGRKFRASLFSPAHYRPLFIDQTKEVQPELNDDQEIVCE